MFSNTGLIAFVCRVPYITMGGDDRIVVDVGKIVVHETDFLSSTGASGAFDGGCVCRFWACRK